MGGKSIKRFFKIFSLFLFSIISVIVIFVAAINIYVCSWAGNYVYDDISQIPEKYTVIVPGAAVVGNKSVSFVLRDRIEGAMELIYDNKCEKFLVSGDHGTKEYDEVNAARKYVQNMHDLDESRIFMDHAGFSTYETMFRARDVFDVSDCVIVTQRFHVYRAVYLARKLGLDAVGYVAPEINTFGKRTHLTWECREILARVKAFFDIMFNTQPTFLGDKIPITGDGRATWK